MFLSVNVYGLKNAELERQKQLLSILREAVSHQLENDRVLGKVTEIFDFAIVFLACMMTTDTTDWNGQLLDLLEYYPR